MPATIANALKTAEARRGRCYLFIEDGRYVFKGPTGRHSLAIAATDDARLEAHWAGFVENNGGEPRLHEWAELMNDREIADDAEPVSWRRYRDNGTPSPETNAHLAIEGADRTLCGRVFPDRIEVLDGSDVPPCRACQRVQEAAEARIERWEAR